MGLCVAPLRFFLQVLYARGALLDDDLLRDVRSVKRSTAIKLGELVDISKLVLPAFSSSVQGQGEQARPGTNEVNGYSESCVDRALASIAMLLQSFMSVSEYRIRSRWDYTGLCRSQQCERAMTHSARHYAVQGCEVRPGLL